MVAKILPRVFEYLPNIYDFSSTLLIKCSRVALIA